MSRYSLNLPTGLKQEAEQWASRHGVSLNQFIVWAVAEKTGALKERLDDPRFPQIAYRLGASRWPTPVLRGTGVRVQTVAMAAHSWGMPPEEIAAEHGLTALHVSEALAFYDAHRDEIEALVAAEQRLEPADA